MNLAKLKDSIQLKGRAAWTENSIIAEMTDSAFEFKADFKSDITLKLEVFGIPAMLGILIDKCFDEKQTIMLPVGKSEIKVTKDLIGIHEIRIIKLNEYSRNQIDFFDIDFKGEYLEKPEENKLKFEFFGDSLTCGYGNLSETRQSPTDESFGKIEDGYKTWCVNISRYYNAEFCICASSGQGVLSDCAGNQEGTIFKYYDVASRLKNIKWDFNSYIADVVFINIGVNDITYARFNNATINWVDYKSRIKVFIDNIRKNNPNCIIVFPMGHDSTNPHFNDLMNVYKEIEKEYSKLYLFTDLTSNQLGADWHPNVDDHQIIANRLEKHLDKILK